MTKSNLILLLLTFLCTACGGAVSSLSVTKQAAASVQTAKTAASNFEVKVMKNGTELASYQQIGARGASALFDGKAVLLLLASPDNKHVLTIDLQGAKAGDYPLAMQYEPAKPGEARLNFMTEGPPALIPATGVVKLDEFNENYCSGSFTSTGTDIKGAPFSIEGKFSKLVVKKN